MFPETCKVYATVIASGTYPISISGNAGTVTNGIYSTGTYSNPSWLSLTKPAVGLSNENTSLRFQIL
jgi:hypothetical protein